MAEDAIHKFFEWGKAEADGGNAFYLFWHPWSDWNEVECIAPADLTNSLQGIGANCTKLPNWLLRWLKAKELADVDAIGGTGGPDYYGYYWAITNSGKFSLDAGPFPIGTFLIAPYYGDGAQGHVAMVMTEAENASDQILLQSDHASWTASDFSWGTPGVNYWRTIAETQMWAGFEWYGEIPGLGVIPLGSGG